MPQPLDYQGAQTQWNIPEQPTPPAPIGLPEPPPDEFATPAGGGGGGDPAPPQAYMENGRQVLDIDGVPHYRDGSWWVRKDVIDQAAESAGIAPGSVLDDPRFSNVVAANRMKYREGLTRNRVAGVNAWNDANWNPIAQQMGYRNWREARRALTQTEAFRNASPQEQEYLWKAGPRIWAEYGGLGPPQATGGAPPDTDPAPGPPVITGGTGRVPPGGPIFSDSWPSWPSRADRGGRLQPPLVTTRPPVAALPQAPNVQIDFGKQFGAPSGASLFKPVKLNPAVGTTKLGRLVKPPV